MKSLKYFLIVFTFFYTSIYANQIDSTTTRFTDNKSIWGLKLGRFHYSDHFSEDGVSGTFFNEQKISKYFYLGGSLLLYKTIGSNEGAISLNGYLSYPLEIGSQKFFLKGGLGLATLGYINPVAMVEVELVVFEFKKSAISVSVQHSFPKLPFIVNIGILF
ncbi:MAG: hypothetical protein IPH97_02090 [Ignavibacteriales bacterium]|nr:hypothetical protein [Ignavibacteriales bacterium]